MCIYIYSIMYVCIYIGSEPFFRGVKILPRVAPALSSVRSSVFFGPWVICSKTTSHHNRVGLKSSDPKGAESSQVL